MTATTIYCDAVNGEVTLMVYRDGTAKCTGFMVRSRRSGQPAGCAGAGCPRLISWRDRLLAGEDEAKP
jgi:hypothetical protein